jgi:hypothetical protein
MRTVQDVQIRIGTIRKDVGIQTIDVGIDLVIRLIS